MNRRKNMPPRLGEWLLRRSVPPGIAGRSIVGDAREEYLEYVRSNSLIPARLWYWLYILPIIARYVGRAPRVTTHRAPLSSGRGLRLGALVYDLRLAVRLLLKRPGFTVAAVATLGLGIGANTTIFSMVYGVLLKPLPYAEPDRLVGVFRADSTVPSSLGPTANLANLFAVPVPTFWDWSELSPVFDHAGAYAPSGFTLTGGDRPERVFGTAATSGVFAALGIPPLLGRPILPEDDAIGAPGKVVLSHGLWQRRFGGEATILGQDVMLNGMAYTIVGVMPRGFQFPGAGVQLWATLDNGRKASTGRKGGFLQVVARLELGIALEQAQREMDLVALRIGEAHPDERGRGVRLAPLKELTVAATQPRLLLLLGAVGLVLLIACANIANLLLVRAAERRRELGVRQALGAGRSRLVAQLLTESTVLSLMGGAVGYLFALATVGPFTAMIPGGLARAGEIGVDLRALAFAGILAVSTGLLIGVLPALRSARIPIADVLQESSRGSFGGRRQSRTQTALVVSEIALAFILLTGAGLFIKSFVRLTAVDPGFVTKDILTMGVVLSGEYRSSGDAVHGFFAELTERLEAVPGVQVVAGASQPPLVGGWSAPPTSVETASGIIADAIHSSSVTPSYFAVMGIPLIAGRALASSDRDGTVPVAVVNQAMVRRYWPNEDPLGHRVRLDYPDNPGWFTVVGVVGDIRYRLQSPPFPEFYLPQAQWPEWYQTMLLKTAADPAVVAAAAREALWAVDPNVPTRVNVLDDQISRSRSVAAPRFSTLLLVCLAGVAALLAVVGVYGVLAYTVAQRVHEIGIRMALGAGKQNLLRHVMRRGVLLAGMGLAVGLVISLVAVRVVESLLFEISPTDPPTLALVALLVTAAALAASYMPARRATKVDPVEALRGE
jgi:putative ABC transport system permease protein